MRKDKSFDDIIKEKLNNVQPAYQPGSWEQFRDRLDTQSMDEDKDIDFFDRVVKHKAPAVHSFGKSDNWSALVHRLDIIYQRERHLAFTKLIEIFALLLLLWTIDFHYSDRELQPVLQAFDEMRLPVDNKKQTHAASPSYKEEEQIAPSQIRNYNLQIAHNQPSVSMTTSSLSALKTTLPETGDVKDTHFTGFTSNTTYLVPEISVLFPQFLTTTDNPLQLDLQPDLVLSVPMNTSDKDRYSLRMFGSTDVNSVITPGSTEGPLSSLDNTIISIPSLQRYALGYSGGASIGITKGRWETELGLIYSAKLYQARPVLYVIGSVSEGFRAEGLKDIELNMISIPVQFKYDFLKSNNWRIYTSVGATFNLILESNYQLADEDAFRSRSFNLSLPNPDPSSTPKSHGLSSKNLEGGFFQGGTFSNNAFLTGMVSAGIERRFHKRWSVFLQPAYQHSLYYFSKGIGPDKDRIHTFSVMSGIRVRL